MSLDELRADLKRNIAEAGKLTTVAEIRDHLVHTLYPTIEAVVEITEEIDDAVGEMVDQTEDYLQAPTAAVFAALIQSSVAISDELRSRAAGDELLSKRLDAHDQLCQQAMVALGEITMIAPEGEEGEGDTDEKDEDAE